MPLANRDWKAIGVGLAELGLVATLLFSVATAFDELHRYLELFSHFRLQYFVASVLFTVPFLVMRWKRYALLGLATVALNAWFVVPWYVPDTAEAASDARSPDPVRLMLANVLVSNQHSDRLLAAIGDAAPDILVIQEATPAWLTALAPIESDYPYRLTEPRDDAFGIALYSKFPLDRTAVIESEPAGLPSLVAVALIGSHRLNVISTHAMPPLGNTNYGVRNLQLDSIAALAARTPRPLVVIGDLNTTMWANHYRRFEAKSGLVNARRGFGVEPTWPMFLVPAMIPIDHVLVSEGVVVTDFGAGPHIGSDHLPIVADVRLIE